VKCSKCGKENAEYLFYCGDCGAELARPPTVEREVVAHETPATQSMHAKPEAEAGDQTIDALVAIAVNVRRIFLVLLLSIVVTLFGGSLSMSLTILMINDDLSNSTTNAVVGLWLSIMVVLLIVGVFYIIKNKTVTRT
jgi:hypothetical protein